MVEEIDYRKQYNSIDLFKFLMAFAVIAIHMEPLINYENKTIMQLYDSCVTLAVPFFFISCGFLLSRKLTMTNKENDLYELKKSLFRFVKLYVLWTIIYTPLWINHYCGMGIDNTKLIYLYLRGLFLLGEQYNAWHLWYLLSSVYALLLLIVLEKTNKLSCKSLVIMIVLISIVSACCDWVSYGDMQLYPHLSIIKKGIRYTIAHGRIFRGAIFIPIGILLSKKQNSTIFNITLFSVAFILEQIIHNDFWVLYLLIIKSIGFFGLVKSIDLKDSVIYKKLRDMSMYIYLIHMYVWTIYYHFGYGYPVKGKLSFLIVSIISTTLAYGYIWIKKRVSH